MRSVRTRAPATRRPSPTSTPTHCWPTWVCRFRCAVDRDVSVHLRGSTFRVKPEWTESRMGSRETVSAPSSSWQYMVRPPASSTIPLTHRRLPVPHPLQWPSRRYAPRLRRHRSGQPTLTANPMGRHDLVRAPARTGGQRRRGELEARADLRRSHPGGRDGGLEFRIRDAAHTLLLCGSEAGHRV